MILFKTCNSIKVLKRPLLLQFLTFFKTENCTEILLDSSGPSANAHDGWFKDNIFGYYQLNSIDSKGNRNYKMNMSDYVNYKSYATFEHWQVWYIK